MPLKKSFLARVFIATAFLGIVVISTAAWSTSPQWSVTPDYESAARDTSFVIRNASGQPETVYTESHAVLILESNYEASSTFHPVNEAARQAERLLTPALEEDGFQVDVWRNANSHNLKSILDDVFSSYGYTPTARLLFYYFGHGYLSGDEGDVNTRAWLVPVDAPNPVKQEREFYRKAIPMADLVAKAKDATLKHAFFAFEACHAGYVIHSLYSLGGPPPRNKMGYVLSSSTQAPVRQFLTAGNLLQDIPADNSFTALLVGALKSPQADTNSDGFITGNKVIAFVESKLPLFSQYPQQPEAGSYPVADGGDMIFGRVETEEPSWSFSPRPNRGWGMVILPTPDAFIRPLPKDVFSPQVLEKATVFFDWDRADLTPRARQVVAEVAAGIKSKLANGVSVVVELDGFADSSPYNQGLSVREAKSVEVELIRDGVAPATIELRGHGNGTKNGAATSGASAQQNRRVEIQVVPSH